jgi:hypothetical protein
LVVAGVIIGTGSIRFFRTYGLSTTSTLIKREDELDPDRHHPVITNSIASEVSSSAAAIANPDLPSVPTQPE